MPFENLFSQVVYRHARKDGIIKVSDSFRKNLFLKYEK